MPTSKAVVSFASQPRYRLVAPSSSSMYSAALDRRSSVTVTSAGAPSSVRFRSLTARSRAGSCFAGESASRDRRWRVANLARGRASIDFDALLRQVFLGSRMEGQRGSDPLILEIDVLGFAMDGDELGLLVEQR